MHTTTDKYTPGKPDTQSIKGRILAILFLAWLALFAGINTIPIESHEAFVLQTAREMGMNNDWVLPYFSGEPRLNKPPLNYWLTLGISSLDPFSNDIEPWHGRVWSMIGGLLLVLSTASIGNKLYGGQVGVLAAALLLGTKGFTEFSHHARPDFLYSALCVVQLFAWIAAWRAEDDSRAQRLSAALGWGLAALATLSKGPQAPAVFLLGFLLFLLCGVDRNRTLKVLRPFTGLLIVLAVCLPWWLLLQERIRAVGVDIGKTQLSGSLLKTLSNWKEILSFFYVSRSLLLLLPTSALVPVLLYLNRQRLTAPAASDRLLLYAGSTMLVVFTVAGHYRPHYMLPLMPLVTLLLAASADRVTLDKVPEKIWQAFCWLGVTSLAIFPALLIRDQQYASGLLLASTGFLLPLLLQTELRKPVWRGHPFAAQVLACSLLATLLFAGFNAYSFRGNRDGDREFALAVGKTLQSNDLLVALENFPDVLPYYARRAVVTASSLEELKKLYGKKGASQDFYLLVQQNKMTAINEVFETTTLLDVGGSKRFPEKKLLFTKILGMHQ